MLRALVLPLVVCSVAVLLGCADSSSSSSVAANRPSSASPPPPPPAPKPPAASEPSAPAADASATAADAGASAGGAGMPGSGAPPGMTMGPIGGPGYSMPPQLQQGSPGPMSSPGPPGMAGSGGPPGMTMGPIGGPGYSMPPQLQQGSPGPMSSPGPPGMAGSGMPGMGGMGPPPGMSLGPYGGGGYSMPPQLQSSPAGAMPGIAGMGLPGAASLGGGGGAAAEPVEEPRESLFTQAQRSMQLGQEKDAMAYAYGSAIAEDATEVLDKYRWVEAFKRPVLAVRWGIGVQVTLSPKNYEGSYYPVGSTQNIPDRPVRSRRGGAQNQPRGGSGGPPVAGGRTGPPGMMPGGSGGPPSMMPGGAGMAPGFPGMPSMPGMSGGATARTGTSDLLTQTAGELGDELVKRLRDKIEAGEYGPLLVDLSAAPPPPAARPAGAGGLAGGMPAGMMSGMPGMMSSAPGGMMSSAPGGMMSSMPAGMSGMPGMPAGMPGMPAGMSSAPIGGGRPQKLPDMVSGGGAAPAAAGGSAPAAGGGAPIAGGSLAPPDEPGVGVPGGGSVPPGMAAAPGMMPRMMGPPGMMPGMMGPPGMMMPGGGAVAAGGNVNPDSLLTGVTMLGKGETKELLKKAAEQGIDVLAVFEVDVEENPKTKFVTNKTRLVVWDVAKGEELVKSPTFQNIQIQKLRAEEQEDEDPVIAGFNKLFAVLDSDPAKAIKVRDVPPELRREHVEGRIAALLGSGPTDKLAVLAEIKYFSHRGLISDGLLAKSYQQLLGDENGLKLAKGSEEERLEVLASLLPSGAK